MAMRSINAEVAAYLLRMGPQIQASIDAERVAPTVYTVEIPRIEECCIDRHPRVKSSPKKYGMSMSGKKRSRK